MRTCLQRSTRYGDAPAASRSCLSRSCLAPSLLAAYAFGATLWAPAFVFAAALVAGAAAWVVPGVASPDATLTFVLAWMLRFALYARGGHARWDYGYGINGVIVNTQLTLQDKMRRIARDWFGLLLIVVSACFAAAALAATTAV